MTLASPAILFAVEAALSAAPRTPAEVHAVMGENCELARTTIRHALAELARQDRATFEGENGRRKYRRSEGMPK